MGNKGLELAHNMILLYLLRLKAFGNSVQLNKSTKSKKSTRGPESRHDTLTYSLQYSSLMSSAYATLTTTHDLMMQLSCPPRHRQNTTLVFGT